MNTQLTQPPVDSLAPLLNPDFIAKLDVEKTERLFALYEREQDRRASREFADAMTECQEEMPNTIKTDGRNSHTGSNYAKYDTVTRAIKPVYTKHGFTISFGEEPCDREGFLIVVATVRHRAGHTEIYRRFAPIDNLGPKGNAVKSILHGCQSSMSYMQRKLLESIFGIAESDDDDDGLAAGTSYVTKEQADELAALVRNTPQGTLEALLEWAACDSLTDIPASKYNGAKKALTAKQIKP